MPTEDSSGLSKPEPLEARLRVKISQVIKLGGKVVGSDLVLDEAALQALKLALDRTCVHLVDSMDVDEGQGPCLRCGRVVKVDD